MAILRSVDDVLGPVLASIGNAARRVPLGAAIGLRLAAEVRTSGERPPRAVALRSGLALRSSDTAGASDHAPALLSSRPRAVLAGDELPEGCDAVVDPAASIEDGAMLMIAESPAPGSNVRLPGHDLRHGAMLADAGDVLTPEAALALAEAGVDMVEAIAPAAHVDLPRGPTKTWLERRLTLLGLLCLEEPGSADILIRSVDPATPPRLALRPGDTGWAACDGSRAIIECPARFDGAVAVFAALVLPIAARMAGTSPMRREVLLTRKIASDLGRSDIVLLRLDGGMADPLCVGDVTLAHLARANAFTIVPPEAEGYAAGASIGATRFDAMLTRVRS